ncbi:rhomboid family intramembrane serine protease [Candidatus Pacearchaeota archaeon]|nr:rhomboid family intramembrane serine protease [Candidatus Pacearchaeota archaeon]
MTKECQIEDKATVNNNVGEVSFQKSRLVRLPIVTLTLIVVLSVFQGYFFGGFSKPEIWKFFICHKNVLTRGQIWRLFSYILLHKNISHLSMDIAYIMVVGSLAEYLRGRWYTLIIWLLCGFLGGLTFVVWDSRFLYLLGSSAATHGLLASIAIWMIVCRGNKLKRVLSGLIIAYLLYMSINAIEYGVMGWPMTSISNSGWDHLGGIIMGIILALSLHLYKRRNVTE